MPSRKSKSKARSMFMDTLRIEAGEGLVHIGLMEYGPDGLRPEVDGPTLEITVPLSQFRPMIDELRATFDAEELATIESNERLAVLASGGPVMKVRRVDGGEALCSWGDESGWPQHALISTACLRSIVPFVHPDA